MLQVQLRTGGCALLLRTPRTTSAVLTLRGNSAINPNLGLRHRSAIGVTEMSDAISVIVSEQTGAISYVKEGVITHGVTPEQLKKYLDENII